MSQHNTHLHRNAAWPLGLSLQLSIRYKRIHHHYINQACYCLHHMNSQNMYHLLHHMKVMNNPTNTEKYVRIEWHINTASHIFERTLQ